MCAFGEKMHIHTDCNLDDRSYTQTWAHLQVVNGECDEYQQENEFNNNIKKDSRFYGSLHYSVRLICVRVYVFCVYFTASIPLELTIFLVLQFKNYTQSYNLFDAYKMRISFKSDYKKTFNLTKALVAANCVIDSSIKMWNCIKKNLCTQYNKLHCTTQGTTQAHGLFSSRTEQKKTRLINSEKVCV